MTAAMAALAIGSDRVRGDDYAFQSLFFLGLLLFHGDADSQYGLRAVRSPGEAEVLR